MTKLKITIGFSPLAIAANDQMDSIQENLTAISRYRPYIYDLHFPHYNPQVCASGRPIRSDLSLDDARRLTMRMISWNNENTRFTLTLLLNYLLHDNYKVVVDNFAREFYPRGIKSVVVADLELIKRLKDRLPDLMIQGSCLSNRMTEEELEEEHREGVTLHNPSVNIIRHPEQLKKNAKAGYAQKVIAFEGCLNHCPDEINPYGHRWYLARGFTMPDAFCTKPRIAADPRYFFKANWVTIDRLKKLMPYMEVVKLPRCRSSIAFALTQFMEAFLNNQPYNIVDFIGAGYQVYLARNVGHVSPQLFSDTFFDTIGSCKMDCRERNCSMCYEIMRSIKYTSYQQKRLARRSNRRHHEYTWCDDASAS